MFSALLLLSIGADTNRSLKIETSRELPPLTEVAVYRSAEGKPRTSPKQVLRFTDLTKLATLPDEGPFDVYASPKGGIPVRVGHKIVVAPGRTHTLKLADALGSLEVFGDKFPRADAIVVTATGDAGPGEKGHVPVQTASDYRVEMVVPAGTYTVWVKPANGARAQKIGENVRVFAGRKSRVE